MQESCFGWAGGCFGGCTFCCVFTESSRPCPGSEGRRIQKPLQTSRCLQAGTSSPLPPQPPQPCLPPSSLPRSRAGAADSRRGAGPEDGARRSTTPACPPRPPSLSAALARYLMRATTRMAPAAPRRDGAQPARHPRTPPAPPCAPAAARPPPCSAPSSRGGRADCLPQLPAGSPGRRRLALRRPGRPLPAAAGKRGPMRSGRWRPGCWAASGAAAEAPRGAPM